MSDETAVSVEVLRSEVAPVVQRATALAVTTPDAYAGAADFLKAVKAAQKRVTDFFGPMKAKAHAAWKEITATEASTLTPLTEAEVMVKRKMLNYAQAEEANRQAEQRKLQAAADEAARKERERLEKEAAKLKTPELREQRMEQAAAVVAPVVEVASVRPVVTGQSIRKTWRARVVDAKAVPREWLVVNDTALQAFARSTKGAVPVAGVEFFEEASLASASR